MSFYTLSKELLDIRNEALYTLASQMYGGLNGSKASNIDRQRIDKLNVLYDRTVNQQGCLSTLYKESEEFNIVKPLFMKPETKGQPVLNVKISVPVKINLKAKLPLIKPKASF
jgi:hypothetical protein